MAGQTENSPLPSDVPPSIPPSSGEVSAGRDVQAGGDIAGRDIAGRDIAGRDIVNETTQVGFSPQAVTRLLIVVGLLVFLTAACFFSGGLAVGVGVFVAINRPVNSNLEAAQSMNAKLNSISALPPNQKFQVGLSETEISSYFRFLVAPQMGIEDGKVRVLNDHSLAVGGRSKDLGNLPFVATFDIQKNNVQEPLKLTSAAVQVIQTGDKKNTSPFGWVAVPTPVLAPFADQINQYLGGNFSITGVQEAPNRPQPALILDGVTAK
jgi:hypothetical protein